MQELFGQNKDALEPTLDRLENPKDQKLTEGGMRLSLIRSMILSHHGRSRENQYHAYPRHESDDSEAGEIRPICLLK